MQRKQFLVSYMRNATPGRPIRHCQFKFKTTLIFSIGGVVVGVGGRCNGVAGYDNVLIVIRKIGCWRKRYHTANMAKYKSLFSVCCGPRTS